MLPQGFLGTRGDILMDLVVLSLIAIIPLLVYSFRLARQKRYAEHKRLQVVLASVLAVVVVLFEVDMQMAGGIFALTAASRFAGTALLNGSIYLHVLLAVGTTLLWIWLIALSLKRFPNPPAPGAFSRTHRRWGRFGMILMLLTGLTGVEVYILGFAF